jgi:hypothetical protein
MKMELKLAVMAMNQQQLDALQRIITNRRKELRGLPLHNMFTIWTAKEPLFTRSCGGDGLISINCPKGRHSLAANETDVVVIFFKGQPWGTTMYKRKDFS